MISSLVFFFFFLLFFFYCLPLVFFHLTLQEGNGFVDKYHPDRSSSGRLDGDGGIHPFHNSHFYRNVRVTSRTIFVSLGDIYFISRSFLGDISFYLNMAHSYPCHLALHKCQVIILIRFCLASFLSLCCLITRLVFEATRELNVSSSHRSPCSLLRLHT